MVQILPSSAPSQDILAQHASNGCTDQNIEAGNTTTPSKTQPTITSAKIIRTPQKSGMDHKQFLMKIKQGKCARKKGETEVITMKMTRPPALKVGFQTSMSEEHPPSPSKFIDTEPFNSQGQITQNGVSTLENSKIITYRPLKSVCGSENSLIDSDR